MSESLRDKSCLIIDHGAFLCLASRLARDDGFGKVYYWAPWSEAFSKIENWSVGQGFDEFDRVDEWEEVVEKVDVVVFPDVHHGACQEFLEKRGKPVWGSRKLDQLEISKLRFKRLQKQLGMNVNKFDVVTGVEALREYCKRHKNKWVKLVKQFRGDRETFFHSSYEESRMTIDEMAVDFGGLQDKVGFILEEPIESDDPDKPIIESGMDTLIIDGEHPDHAVLGVEIKDRCYAATVKPYEDFPEEVRECTDLLLPTLREGRYRNWFSTEIRIKNGKPILLEPTCRQASPAGEEQLMLYKNLPRIIYEGAHGRLIQPEIEEAFAVEAMIDHKDDDEHGRTLRVPSEIQEWVMLYSCAKDGDLYHIKPGVSIIGAVVGIGNTLMEAIEHLKSNAAKLDSKKAHVDVDALVEAVQEIKDSEEQGMPFSDEPIPEPVEVLNGD